MSLHIIVSDKQLPILMTETLYYFCGGMKRSLLFPTPTSLLFLLLFLNPYCPFGSFCSAPLCSRLWLAAPPAVWVIP